MSESQSSAQIGVTGLAVMGRNLARNLARQLTVYATGAPMSFGDRAEIEAIVQRTSARRYGLRSLIHEVVQSPLFLKK